MKLNIVLRILLVALYAGYHFGLLSVGERQFYRINDSIAFELRLRPNLSYEVTVHRYQQTNPLIRSICGCAIDYNYSELMDAQYIKGDWVYSGYPQHSTVRSDIVNLQTGEILNVDAKDEMFFDLQTVPEYRERGLVKSEQYELKADYVKANFERLWIYTSRCLWIHLVFGVLALFLIFPRLFLFAVEILAGVFDSNNPSNYLNPK